jgi:hypothetical protein
MSLTTIVASIAAAAAVAGGVAAGAAILTTSGPFTDSDSDNPAASETATETSTITETPTAVDATPTTEPSATPGPELVLDENGWPIIECPDGSDSFRFEDRRITVCAPGEWSDRHWLEYRDGPDPRYTASTVVMRSPEAGLPGLQITVIERSSGPPDHFRSSCEAPEPAELLYVPGAICVGTQENPNGLSLAGEAWWMIEVFAETDTRYVKAIAAGTEHDPGAIEEMKQVILANLRASAQNGLETIE